MNTDHFKEKLSAERVKLETEMQAIGRRNPLVPNDFEPVATEKGQESDVVDQADTIESFEENRAILHDLEIRYQEVLAALARIEQGTYGACETCGAHIEEERLEADPAAKTCAAHL